MTVKLKLKMTANGYLYIPKEIRPIFGKDITVLANAHSVVLFPEGTDLNLVKKSLKIILDDIELRLSAPTPIINSTLNIIDVPKLTIKVNKNRIEFKCGEKFASSDLFRVVGLINKYNIHKVVDSIYSELTKKYNFPSDIPKETVFSEIRKIEILYSKKS